MKLGEVIETHNSDDTIIINNLVNNVVLVKQQ